MSAQPGRLAALAWLTRKNYAAHLALDPTGLPPTYDAWHRRAQRLAKQVEREPGVLVRRVPVDPDALAAWCHANTRSVDAKARAEFAAFVWAEGHDH